MANAKFVIVLAIVALVAAAVPMTEALTCGQIQGSLAPCLTYLKSGGAPATGCCKGIKDLVAMAKTTADRKSACNCLKNAASKVPGINPTFASALPSKCGANIPYKISTSTNCNSVR
ncbi:non-specific lipid-transfer protein 1-like [Humulus lupulus]|uniref:non-specific lipid-transfer protein 1-like n=1 Tax=Humulus lupulus TaxID=3486 RepID=UPI002B40D917|nr:non-specific lipid-transfer protein 1-like [Humulus lupulus]